MTPEEEEMRAQSVLRCLRSATKPPTADQVALFLFLSPEAARIALNALEDRGRAVRVQSFGEREPQWLATE